MRSQQNDLLIDFMSNKSNDCHRQHRQHPHHLVYEIETNDLLIRSISSKLFDLLSILVSILDRIVNPQFLSHSTLNTLKIFNEIIQKKQNNLCVRSILNKSFDFI